MPKVVASSPGASGRHQRGRRLGPTMSEINIIPLVDVMLVLLIIFMVAAPMMQKGVEVNLPVARRADKLTNAEPLYVTIPASYRQDRRIYLDKESIPVDVLGERMKQAMTARSDKQVYLRGDGAVQLQELMDVFGRLKEAGVQKIGVVAEERRAR